MKNSSARRNLVALAALFGISLVVACGCPSSTPPAKTGKSAGNGGGERAKENDKSAKPAPFDPVVVNGKFFEGWEKPKLAILISGRQNGYLEPCGCAGLENQKGGLSRRHALVKELRDKRGWPLVAVDVGNQVRRYGKQAEIQFATAVEALAIMGYEAVGFGIDDLKLSTGEITGQITQDPNQIIFVSANVDPLGAGLVPKFKIIEAGGMKIGVTSVLGPSYAREINNPELEIQPAAEALAVVLPELKDCDHRILLAHAAHVTKPETEDLAKQFPEFDIVVTAEGGDEPPAKAAEIAGTKSRLIEVGHKGMFAVVLGFYDKKGEASEPFRYQRVALDSRYPNTPEMQKLKTQYQERLQKEGWEGLGLRPLPHPRAQQGDELSGQFIGAEQCRACHKMAWQTWHLTPHAKATETLAKLDPPRQYDPECISCHSTGWDTHDFFPYTSGFDSLEATPHLAGNMCENCHGPGAAHASAEKGKDAELQRTLRLAVQLTKDAAKQNICGNCHDHDNSPDFDFEKYWPKVEHHGKN